MNKRSDHEVSSINNSDSDEGGDKEDEENEGEADQNEEVLRDVGIGQQIEEGTVEEKVSGERVHLGGT